jgi:hypothetical protein
MVMILFLMEKVWGEKLRNTGFSIFKYRLDLIYSDAFPGENTEVIL